ncbi:DNA repair exonuclease [Candidatus Nitronereus thalassa]|uniref:DNA repair exonuclease n=1 Tax=Candidatus Nitronereus thalassa TaxID=3020898 RepID=A0ABU3K9U4_9BACT|nr:DNA repair exonuclease [Candidatus Nitronereus thalassa]MDT7043104.1 DNA repair exonuclease [Candidatus Nitronereus thalassa]
MSAFQFVHTADLHLDSPFRGLSEVAPALQSVLREATFQAFERIIDLCINRDVNFLLIAGDIHDASDRSLRALTRLRQGFERLADHHIPVFMCHGNHDPLTGWSEHFSWPDNVWVFDTKEVAARPVLVQGAEIARIYGVSFGMEKVTDNLAQQFQGDPEAPWSIGLLHTNVGQDPNHGNYAPCQLDDLVRAGMNYWALGHVHTHRILRDQDPLIIYPGNPQGRHVRETGPRGCYLVSVDSQGHASPEFVPVDVVRWYDERLTIMGLGDFDDLLNRMDERVHVIRQQSEGRGVVVRWQFEGRGPLHRELIRPGRLEDLLMTIREKWGTGSQFVWSEAVHDRTGREVDLDGIRHEENLLGDFIRLTEIEDASNLQHIRQAIEPLFDDPRVYRYLGAPSDAQIREWVQTAQHLGLDRLLTGDE